MIEHFKSVQVICVLEKVNLTKNYNITLISVYVKVDVKHVFERFQNLTTVSDSYIVITHEIVLKLNNSYFARLCRK